MEERYFYFICWSLLWILLLNIPPGSTAIISAYRLNFTHGVISTVVATACLLGYLPESVTTVCTISYFIVDFVNILINDFIWKAKSYQNPQNRKVEYFHHILCATVGIVSEYKYNQYCTFQQNPFVNLMFAEFSTPFLIAWRYTNSDILGGLFVVAFFLCRIAYQAGILIPDCMRSCVPSIGYGFGIPYNLMNIYFFYMIIRKILRPPKKDEDSSKNQ